MAELVVHDLSLDDRDAALDIRHRSFGRLSPDGLAWWGPLFEKTVAARRTLGVYAGDRLVAMGRLHGYRQVWGGRAVAMAGVAGVDVAPEWRGRGASTLLMTAILERAVELGDALAVLFPAAVPPYRMLGFEVAGMVTKTTFSANSLRGRRAGDLSVRQPTVGDVDEIVAMMRREAARCRDSGPLELSADDVRELLTDDDNFCYLAADGVLVYAWDGQDLRVERLVAESAETTRGLWALAGSGASFVRNVYTYQPVHDPVHLIFDDLAKPGVEQERWMLRVTDARAAVAGRGFPAGVTADVPLRLDDAWLEGCAGSFRLRVSGGTGELIPDHGSDQGPGPVPNPAPGGGPNAGEDAVRLGPNGLATLYAGTPMSAIRRAGLAGGGTPAYDALLDAAFAAHPYLIDSF
jgi:predicted acetyltransferase